MTEKSLDIIYNLKNLVIVPKMKEELLESFQYTFKNAILMKNDYDEINYMINFINKNNFKRIIFVNYQLEYEKLIEEIADTHQIDFIFTESLASFSDQFIYNTFKSIYNLHKKIETSKLGILDTGLYESLKRKKDNVSYILLDIEKNNANNLEYDSKYIGILNNEEKNTHSFYNELSAIKLIEDSIVKLPKFNKITKKFLKTFNVKYKKCNTKDNLLTNNLANLYINFTENNNIKFLESMDNNVPCILGNSDILDNNKYLKTMLVVKSDDDINEIATKVKNIKNNREKILKEYQKFRKDYSKNSQKLVEEFLGERIAESEKNNYEKLLSVIVPVYNTAKYLEKSLDSIIDSEIDNMEIVVINDGSKDNSEDIILKYQKRYPDLIRYIKQENHGLGNVRNVGLKEAKGKYIASVDSDDTINYNFFTDSLKYMEKDVDIIICDWLTITDETEYETAALDYIFKDINYYEGLLYTTIMPSTCNKIIKKSLFDELEIEYIEDKYEDLSTNPFIMLKAKTVKYLNKPYYEYYIRSNSIMRTKPGYSMIDILKIVNDRLLKYKEYVNVDMDKFKYYTFAWRIEEYIINQLYTIDEEEIKSFAEYLDKNFRLILLEMFENRYYKERIETLSKEKQEYIKSRNKSIESNKLEKFIKESRKKENYQILTPPIMYYGDN